MNTSDMEQMLWQYLDGTASREESIYIKKMIDSDPSWKAAYQELSTLESLLHSADLEQPSMRFAVNVMEEIARHNIAPSTRTYLNKKIIYGIGLFFLAAITGMLIYAFAAINWADQEPSTTFSLPTQAIEWGFFTGNRFMQIFMMANIVLALVLLDKYLHRKKDRSAHS